jgi:hypothetical protein
MVTIKGPLHFKKGFSTDEMVKKIKDGELKVKLPFSATGWESTKMPEAADLSGIELKKESKPKTKPKKKPAKKKK